MKFKECVIIVHMEITYDKWMDITTNSLYLCVRTSFTLTVSPLPMMPTGNGWNKLLHLDFSWFISEREKKRLNPCTFRKSNKLFSKFHNKIAQHTTWVKGCNFLAGFLQVSHKCLGHLLKVCRKSLKSLLQVSKSY